MNQTVVHIEPVGAITISRNRRSRKLRMTVKPDKQVMVTIPFYTSFRDAILFAQKNTDWIIKQQKKLDTVSVKYTIGSNLQTKFHTITILKGFEKSKAVRIPGQVKVYVADDTLQENQDFIRSVLTEIYRIEAKLYLPPRISELAGRFGFRFSRIAVRNNRRNWGSCSSKNNINMNLQVMKLPDELIDFIILHELVHTVEKNHGPKFWELLDKVTGNRARELTKKIKKFTPYLP
jgi:predicted metal-dependent hydrolase